MTTHRPRGLHAPTYLDNEFRQLFRNLAFYHETGGVFKGLMAAQTLVEAVCDEGLAETDLGGYRLLVLPNSVHLPPGAAENLRRYVENGGALLASMETGRRDACGRAPGDALLWDGAGLTTQGVIETLAPLKVPPRGVLHLVNELGSSGVREMPQRDHVPVPARLRIALPGVRRVKAVIGGAGCEIEPSGKAWLVRHAGIVERLVLVCQE